MNPEYVEMVNTFQEFLNTISSRESYLFYSQLLPKKRQFNKYIKPSTQVSYEAWMVDAVATYFTVSHHEAIEYIHIMYLTDPGKAQLRHICEIFFIEDKKLTKANL